MCMDQSLGLWQMAGFQVSSLVSSHPWVCVFDYVRQHTHSSL